MKALKPIKNPEEPIWFILYNGESEDGRGFGTYAGRTKSVTVAFTFYKQFIHKNPHSTGRVEALNDTGMRSMTFEGLEDMDTRARIREEKLERSASKKYDIRTMPWNPEEQPAIPKPDGFGKWQ